MTLTYWVCPNAQSRSYSIRARTKAECEYLRKESGIKEDFDPPQKVVIHYKDDFDLLNQLLGEGGREPDYMG